MKKQINKSVRKQARRTRALERFSIISTYKREEETHAAYKGYLDRKEVELTALKSALGVQ